MSRDLCNVFLKPNGDMILDDCLKNLRGYIHLCAKIGARYHMLLRTTLDINYIPAIVFIHGLKLTWLERLICSMFKKLSMLY